MADIADQAGDHIENTESAAIAEQRRNSTVGKVMVDVDIEIINKRRGRGIKDMHRM